jgi:hydroxymethylglutaryl-CoA lyase
MNILSSLNVSIISLADTIGISQPEQIRYLFTHLTRDFPSIEFGAHLHSHASSATDKIEAAFQSGCQRFDGAIHGWGGCPMAEDDLVGNLATESILSFLEAHGVDAGLNKPEFLASVKLADEIFPS